MGTYSKPAKQLVKLNKRQVKQGFWELIFGMGGRGDCNKFQKEKSCLTKAYFSQNFQKPEFWIPDPFSKFYYISPSWHYASYIYVLQT